MNNRSTQEIIEQKKDVLFFAICILVTVQMEFIVVSRIVYRTLAMIAMSRWRRLQVLKIDFGLDLSIKTDWDARNSVKKKHSCIVDKIKNVPYPKSKMVLKH